MRSLLYVSPALILSVGSVFVLLAGLWIRSHVTILASTLVTLLAAGWAYLSMIGRPMQDAFAGLIVFDPFGLFFAVFAVVVVALGILLSARSHEIKADRRSEYYSILLALTTGLIFMGISNHLLMAYLALETVSILSYTLAGFNRERSASVEASMKYVIYGSMASAMMVFGISLLFGVTGQLSMTGLRQFFTTVPADQIPGLLWVSVLLIFAGFGYKISAAPMHMWTPDVYEGAPTPVSALFSVAPKAAGIALLLRFFITGFTVPSVAGGPAVALGSAAEVSFNIVGNFDWPRFLMISSVFTMFMGNLAALSQFSVKRILGYSSIAHAGYMLMGASTQTASGIQGILFYAVSYCFMNLGAFWIASKVDDTLGGDHLKHFRGLIQRRPYYAVAMGVFLVSLIGIPPFAGFFGKFYLFSAVIAREMYGFALLAGLNSAISLYYYAKILKAMFFEAPEVPMPDGRNAFDSISSHVLVVLFVIPNVALGLWAEPLMKLISHATVFFTGP